MADDVDFASGPSARRELTRDDAGGYRSAPHNIEAEQALLGAVLINNEAIDRAPKLEQDHFYDPVHGRIFALAKQRYQQGKLVTPVTMKTAMEADPGLIELGGWIYLKRLAEAATTVYHVKDYADTIYGLAQRRRLAEIGETIAADALDAAVEATPEEQIAKAEEALYALVQTGQTERGFRPFRSAVIDAVLSAEAAYKREGQLSGISTGLRDLDEKLGGLHKSDLLIIAGRPSMGKTALVTNIAYNIAKEFRRGEDEDGVERLLSGGSVGFFSLEMSASQLATRVLAEQAAIASEKLRTGMLEVEEFRRLVDAATELERAPLFIDDTPALRIDALAARARRLKRQKTGLDVLVVDYLQLCRGTSRNGDNRVQEVSEITQGLKAIAKELDIPVIALSQLSRKVEDREDKRPMLSDLRESGSIEQDADVVMFVYREEYYLSRQEPREGTAEHVDWQAKMAEVHNLAEVIIGKQRHGPIGSVKLAFENEFTRFSDRVKNEGRYERR